MPPQKSVQLPEDKEDEIINKQPENSPHQNTGSPLDFPDTEEPNNGTDSPNGQEHVEESTGIGSRLPTRERCPPWEWWKPWEPPQMNMELGDATANSAWEPQGEPQSYAEAAK